MVNDLILKFFNQSISCFQYVSSEGWWQLEWKRQISCWQIMIQFHKQSWIDHIHKVEIKFIIHHRLEVNTKSHRVTPQLKHCAQGAWNFAIQSIVTQVQGLEISIQKWPNDMARFQRKSNPRSSLCGVQKVFPIVYTWFLCKASPINSFPTLETQTTFFRMVNPKSWRGAMGSKRHDNVYIYIYT